MIDICQSDLKLFNLQDYRANQHLEVTAIHNEQGYREVRERLAAQYNLSNLEPNIQITNVDINGDRSLTLEYVPHNHIPLSKSVDEMMKHLHRLWGFKVQLMNKDENGELTLLSECPALTPKEQERANG